MASFRFDVEQPVRYRDLDTLGHVNNAVYGTYFEEARMQYLSHVLDVLREELGIAMVHIDIDFRRQVTLEDEFVSVGCRVSEIGDSSFEMAYRVDTGADSAPAATAESVQVAWDGESSIPVPDAWREQITAYEPSL